MRIATALCLLAVFTAGATPAGAAPRKGQDGVPLDHLPALRGDYFRIESSATGRPYHIYVRYPEG